MILQFTYTDIAYICVWAFIGSVLGFLSFRYDFKTTITSKLKQCLLSVSLGLFISLPLYAYLQWLNKFPKNLNIMLCGIGAFGLPDFILTHWSKLTQAIVQKIVNKTIDDYDKKR